MGMLPGLWGCKSIGGVMIIFSFKLFGLFNNFSYLRMCLRGAEGLEQPSLVSSVMPTVQIQKNHL